jgi:C_GCAxxG_C_C family probable redox protein
MNKIEEAVSCFKSGYSCSQAITATYGPDQGMPRELALRVASGFGGGMGTADTCGAVTGALMILGLHLAGANAQAPTARASAKAAAVQYAEMFKARRGTVMCRDLLGCDISTAQGIECARKQGLFARVCPKVVHDAAELLEELLARS